jgi:hypothetical protein
MAEPICWSRWSIPRLPDAPDCDPWATRRLFSLDREAEVWNYLAGSLQLGWQVTPLLYDAAAKKWICLAFNIQGCSASQAGVAIIDPDRRSVIASLGAYFKYQVDDECSRPVQHGRLE